MDFKQFTKEIEKHEKEIDTLARRRFPAKVAAKAERHYRGNFSRGGFLNNGHHPWKTTKRQMSGGEDAASKYGPLLSGREHLKSSVIGESMPYRAKVHNRVPYAAIHNFGGTFTIRTHPAVTPKMRRFGWAKYREAGGKDNPEASGRWKALALTKKERLDINIKITIPQRQFIGYSAELDRELNELLDKELENILNK